MKGQVFHLTPDGLLELKQELAQLKDNRLPEAIERVRKAREYGDLSENSEYHAAREDLTILEGRIEELEELIGKAKVVKKSNSHKVGLGSKVTVKSDDKLHTYHIVGKYEADPIKKKISDESPLGQALMGRRIGENIEHEAPIGKVAYTITSLD